MTKFFHGVTVVPVCHIPGHYRQCGHFRDWAAGGRILTGARDFSFLQNYLTSLWDMPGFLFNEYRGSFPVLKWQWFAVDHSHPSNAEVKNYGR